MYAKPKSERAVCRRTTEPYRLLDARKDKNQIIDLPEIVFHFKRYFSQIRSQYFRHKMGNRFYAGRSSMRRMEGWMF